MRLFIVKLCSFFSLLFLSHPLLAIIDVSQQEIAAQAIPFVDGLSTIEAQLQENDYREQLYYFLSDDGIHRLLVVNNPQRKTIKIGFMSIGMRVIVGHHGDFPEGWMEQIEQLIDSKEIKGVMYSAGTYNGKTIFEVFGY